MLNLDQITEQGVRLDLQGLVILKDEKEAQKREKEGGGDKVKALNGKLHTCASFYKVCVHVAHSTKDTRDVYLPHAALLLDFIKT